MDVKSANKEHAESRKIQNKILKWDDKESPLAKLGDLQISVISEIEELNTKAKVQKVNKKCSTQIAQLIEFIAFRLMMSPRQQVMTSLKTLICSNPLSSRRRISSQCTTKSKNFSRINLMTFTVSSTIN